jgi:two-component system OmpR family sensor kinase
MTALFPDPHHQAPDGEPPSLPGRDSPTQKGPSHGARTPRPRIGWLGRVPLRAQLLGIVITLLGIALGVTLIAANAILPGVLMSQVDDRLRGVAQPVAQHAVRQINQSESCDDPSPGGPGGIVPSDFAVHVSLDDGSLSVTCRAAVGSDATSAGPAFRNLTYEQAAATHVRPFTLTSADGERWRVIAFPLGDRNSTHVGSVLVALPLDTVDQAVNRVQAIVLLTGLLAGVACALLGWVAIRRAFVPLVEVEDTAAAIARGDLSRRVPARPATTEVGRLTASLNGMLAQIESAFRDRETSEARTRRFAADASHELRTPLASIRGFAELYRQGAVSTPGEVSRTMRRIEDEATRMGALVEDLLLLARLDEQRPGRADPVDLAVLAGDAVHDVRGLDPDRPARLVGLRADGGPMPAVVIGDENQLRQVVANLVANAVRHTPARTPIEVAVGLESGTAVLEVRDHGPGLSPEHADRVFERFYRVDASRSRGRGGGSGLGLSIVSAVVAAHGGQVSVHPTGGGGATFRVEIPPAASGDGRPVPPATQTFVTIPSPPVAPEHEQPEILDSLPGSRTDPAV